MRMDLSGESQQPNEQLPQAQISRQRGAAELQDRFVRRGKDQRRKCWRWVTIDQFVWTIGWPPYPAKFIERHPGFYEQERRAAADATALEMCVMRRGQRATSGHRVHPCGVLGHRAFDTARPQFGRCLCIFFRRCKRCVGE